MSRQSVMVPINGLVLKTTLIKNGWTIETMGEFFGVSRQAANAWILEGRMPPRKLADLAEKLSLPAETVKEILSAEETSRDLARELRRLRNENARLKAAILALTDNGDDR